MLNIDFLYNLKFLIHTQIIHQQNSFEICLVVALGS